MEIQIHNFPDELPDSPETWKKLIDSLIRELQMEVESLNIVFVDDATLQKMHLEYLNDPQKTDVITFDLSEGPRIEGEIYISSERAAEQAKEYGVPFAQEVLRLIIHGILHLKGFDDLEAQDRKIMKQEEERLVQKYWQELTK